MKVHTIGGLLAGCGLDRLDAHLLLEQEASGLSYPADHLAQAEGISGKRRSVFWRWQPAGWPANRWRIFWAWGNCWTADFRVTPDTLIPRPETEHLVEFALAHLPPAGHMLDLGTGSGGAIAVTVACERPDARVTALDVSAAALAVARSNGQHLQAQVRWLESDWFFGIAGRRAFSG